MSEFKGWTPATIDNLTFDQLDAIVTQFNKKMTRGKTDKEVNLAGVPSSKGTQDEINAWCKAGCPPTFKSFLEKLKAASNA